MDKHYEAMARQVSAPVTLPAPLPAGDIGDISGDVGIEAAHGFHGIIRKKSQFTEG